MSQNKRAQARGQREIAVDLDWKQSVTDEATDFVRMFYDAG